MPGDLRLIPLILSLFFLSCCAQATVSGGVDSLAAPEPAAASSRQSVQMQSPHGHVMVLFGVGEREGKAGVPYYQVSFENTEVVASSAVGLNFVDLDLSGDFRISQVKKSDLTSEYSLVLGKTRHVLSQFTEYEISLEQFSAPRRRLELIFRIYDNGAAFRYRVPDQPGMKSAAEVALQREGTQIALSGQPTVYGLQMGFGSAYEFLYSVGGVEQLSRASDFGLPLAVKLSDVYLEITEANIHGYAHSYLRPLSSHGQLNFAVDLASARGHEDRPVQGVLPFLTPWRVFILGASPAAAIESNIVTDLSEPTKIENQSWIQSGHILFQWWNGYVLPGQQFQPASAVLQEKTLKSYIDFCQQNHIPFFSIDGYEFEKAWYGGKIFDFQPGTDVTKSAPEMNVPEVIRYATERGVAIRIWVHTAGLTNQNMDDVLAQYAKWGAKAVMVDFMSDDTQYGVDHIERILATAARYHLLVSLHGIAKPTGLQRTYPNFVSQEGVLNQEYNKWNPAGPHSTPDHEVLAAIIRGSVGPMDTHQGSVRPVPESRFQIHALAPNSIGTLAHQLANYIVYENGQPMLSDYPAAYLAHPAAFTFIRKVPIGWDETRALAVSLEQRFVSVARRSGADWYIGSMCGNHRIELRLPLRFLEPGASYIAEIYADSPLSEKDGESMQVKRRLVRSTDTLHTVLAVGGGEAIHIHRVH
jgi:alpha-glucosidase